MIFAMAWISMLWLVTPNMTLQRSHVTHQVTYWPETLWPFKGHIYLGVATPWFRPISDSQTALLGRLRFFKTDLLLQHHTKIFIFCIRMPKMGDSEIYILVKTSRLQFLKISGVFAAFFGSFPKSLSRHDRRMRAALTSHMATAMQAFCIQSNLLFGGSCIWSEAKNTKYRLVQNVLNITNSMFLGL